MNQDEMFEEIFNEVDTVPIMCNKGLEHSDKWMGIENGEEKLIFCSECTGKAVRNFFESKIKAFGKMLRHMKDRGQLKKFLEYEEDNSSDKIKCSKCGSKDVEPVHKQPPTIGTEFRVKCKDCGNKWSVADTYANMLKLWNIDLTGFGD